MPRDLKRSDDNKLVIHDSISGEKVALYYRQPTAEEYIKYHQTVTKRGDDGKLVFDEEARIEFALAIITGVADGCLAFEGKSISTTEGADGYNAEWKQLIKDTAADWLMILAGEVFDGTYKAAPSVPFVKR